MCIGGTPSVSYPTVSSTRDTSNELIVSKYELSEENKKKNAEIVARNRAKSLVNFTGGGDDNPSGAGVTISGGTMQASTPTGNYGGMDMSNIA